MKVAVVAIVGRTNAGKSTLVNQLVGEKVSIVSPCEQTTRNTIRGIVSDPRGQLVLLDTPGLHKAVGPLGRLLNRMARRSSAGTDILCVVFDASEVPQLEDIGWMQRVAKEHPEKVVFVLNKADKQPFFEEEYRAAWSEALKEGRERPLPVDAVAHRVTEKCGLSSSDAESLRVYEKEAPSAARHPHWVKSISTTEGGAKSVADVLFDLSEDGEPLFDDDIVTDYPRKLTIADVIREKYIGKLFQELPHELGILVTRIDERKGIEWKVKADVIVNRDSQKPMAIGKGAGIIKGVRKAAEKELKEIYGLKVTLELTVRVERNWMKNERLLAEMGYLGELV